MAPPDRDTRIANAFRAMRSLGVDAETVKPVLRRLLKLYNRNWALIEEDNYRTLADAIFEYEDDKLKAEKNGDMINEDIEPPLKKPYRANSEDKVSSNAHKGKDIAGTKGEVPKCSCGRTIELPQIDSRDPTNKPYHSVSKSPSGSKRTSPVHLNSASYEGNSSTQPASGARHANHEFNDPRLGSVMRETTLDHNNRNEIVPREMQLVDHSPKFADKKRAYKVSDITRGTEKVQISLIDEMGYEEVPHFVYCPENITYESAYVHVSLARIADEDCCSDCIGDCLSSSIPCACAHVTGGEFAYTPEGLLNEKFLNSCISMKLSPSKHEFYCQDCPLERAKNVRKPGKCKGHIWRKFIKECWRKCGCNMQCGNRVVQRGITRKLQVFLTSKGKGWGLRTLDDLPKGAFVCEYVGEILTNIELYERNKKSSGKDKHVYPVLLDADWATEENLKDEDALCLDATHYGNVARFINHRCNDGNLIDIPVQVETPDRHYYHIAFFTTRKVDALEELTWDYQIDFDDINHPIKAFQCRCGSKYCRDRTGRR